jgi:hypothetical protein
MASHSTFGEPLADVLYMAEHEAMYISFADKELPWKSDRAKFAIKVYVGGINAVSGERANEPGIARYRRAKALASSTNIQDYVVVPLQKWLDGVAVTPGRVRQFVTTPFGSGHSVEAQMTQEEVNGGISIEITPTKPPPPVEFPDSSQARKVPIPRPTATMRNANHSHAMSSEGDNPPPPQPAPRPPPWLDNPSNLLLNLFLRDLDSGRTFALANVPLTSTVEQLRELNPTKADSDFYRLLYGGKELEDGISSLMCLQAYADRICRT